MRAAIFHSYGSPDVLVVDDAPEPHAGPDSVRIRVQATSVNPIDFYLRAGHLQQFLPLTLPAIPGRDAVGVVDEVGAGVTNTQVGDLVFGLGGVSDNERRGNRVGPGAHDVAVARVLLVPRLLRVEEGLLLRRDRRSIEVRGERTMNDMDAGDFVGVHCRQPPNTRPADVPAEGEVAVVAQRGHERVEALGDRRSGELF